MRCWHRLRGWDAEMGIWHGVLRWDAGMACGMGCEDETLA